MTGCSVIYGLLQHSGAELSALETITVMQVDGASIARLAAEYETLSAVAQIDQWVRRVRASGLSDEQVDTGVESGAFGALTAELRRAEANHHDVDALFPHLVAARGFDDADDIAKVINYRLARPTTRPAGSGRTQTAPALIAGLIPQARGPMTTEIRQALTERRDLIKARADAVLDTALTDHESRTRTLGTPPKEQRSAARWWCDARIVAAYRDRDQITETNPLGSSPDADAQKLDHSRARAALRRLAPKTKQTEPSTWGGGRAPEV